MLHTVQTQEANTVVKESRKRKRWIAATYVRITASKHTLTAEFPPLGGEDQESLAEHRRQMYLSQFIFQD